MEINQRYSERRDRFEKLADRYARQAGSLSLVRLVFFLVGAAILIWIYSLSWLACLIGLFVFIASFMWMVRAHQQKINRSRHFRLLAKINRIELKYREHQFQARPRGERYKTPTHFYTADLDFFGTHSLFQYLNRSETESGQDLLAGWLSASAEVSEIQERQEAIRELKEKLDWRQEWQARASRIQGDRRIEQALRNWLEDENLVVNHSGLRISLWLVPLGWIAVITAVILGVSWSLILLYLVFPAILLSRHASRVNRLHERTGKASDQLSGMGDLLAHLEVSSFGSIRLQGLQETLSGDPVRLSRSFKQLSYFAAQLDVRNNVFAILLNLLMLWDYFWILKLEKWKKRERVRLPEGFRVMAEMEALQSLAANAFNNPDWAFPVFSKERHLCASGLGHPLIAAEKRVVNDLSMPLGYHMKLITGSNMAGKSTFLRSVGINLVLAHAGSPVCAQDLTLSPVQVFTSMRTQDKLSDSTSSFFAELKRLRKLIEEVEAKSDTVFYLLDEILKGTNSRDRHRGGEALIRQLIQYPSAGLIATHDLELGKLEGEFPEQIENWRLEVEIEGDELDFDYKLKRGVSQSFNASILMRKMGIRFGEDPADSS
jgi:hypothetical protein